MSEASAAPGGPDTGSEPHPTAEDWQRLSGRVIWVDLARSLLSLAPSAVAIWVFGVEPTASVLWPLLIIAVIGVTSALADVVRWVFTRYRVTPTEVRRRTGLLVRRDRSVRRNRIRSVDTHARLRHRLTGLRVVEIGAGQSTSAGESAFSLDALTRSDAEALRRLLQRDRTTSPARAPATATQPDAEQTEPDETVDVLATLRPWWVVYNIFGVVAYLMAAGLLWGGFWLAATFGVDVIGWVSGLADWEALGWGWTIAIALVATGALGMAGMAVAFFTSYWSFELARVRRPDGIVLRTRRGLFSTREVSRDESRARGLTIAEPVLWRWMGMADTSIVTTGLGLWSAEQPASILPRGPVSVAKDVAAQVLGEDPSPFAVPLARHPRAALRRRLWWATLVAVTAAALVLGPVLAGVAPGWLLWVVLGLWLLGLLGAGIAYRALGHAIAGPHVVTRSGLVSRATTALRRDAVSTIAVRQSFLQRRLGLSTVATMTAAGWGVYEVPDVDAHAALDFADAAAPGLLAPYLRPPEPSSGTVAPSSTARHPST